MLISQPALYVSATSLDSIECATTNNQQLECLQNAITSQSDCSITDVACSCEAANNKAITDAATPCVLGACQGDDLTKTLEVSQAICAPGNDAGGEAPVSSSSEEAPASTSTKVEETTVAEVTSSSTATVTTSADAEETTDVGAPSTVYVTVCDSSSTKAPEAPKPTGNATAPVEPPTFTGAAGKLGATLGSVAAFALVALAL